MKKYNEPIIDVLLFDEGEIVHLSTQNYSQGQAANYILGQKVTDTNSSDHSQSAITGVDVRSIPIKTLE